MTFEEVSAGIAVVTAIGGGIGYLIRRVSKMLRYLGQIDSAQATTAELKTAVSHVILPAIHKADEQATANFAVLDRLATEIKAIGDTVKKELRPNGGSSLFDMISELRTVGLFAAAEQRVLAATTGVALVHCDALGRYSRCSPEFLKLFGRPADDFLGDAWQATVADADRERVFASWDECVKRGLPFHETFGVCNANGYLVTAAVAGEPLLSPDRKLRGFLLLIRAVKVAQEPAPRPRPRI